MTDKLVTSETAEMLKEKGFDIPVESISKFCSNLLQRFGVNVKRDDPLFFYDDRPPQSIVQKWLRETKKLHVEVSYMYGDYWIYDILTIPNHDLVGLSDRPLVHYKSYEEALEEGIQEALKLI